MTVPFPPLDWLDAPATSTEIDQVNLRRMEQGIAAASLVFNPCAPAYGAKGDGRRIRGVNASTASTAVTVTSGSFTAADVGKLVVVYSDTAAGTITTIAAVISSTSITLAANAGITVSGTAGYLIYGSDDSGPINAALAAAAALTAVDTTVGPNQPQGLGKPIVVLPPRAPHSLFLLGGALTVPSGVTFDCGNALLVNLLASRTAAAVVFSPYSKGHRFELEAMFGAGIQLGSAAGNQADVELDSIRLWHVGKSTGQIGINALGYEFRIGRIWIKGGDTAIVHNAGSDWKCGWAQIIGAHVAISMSQSNQVRYNGIILDSCGETTSGYSGIVLDNACSDITLAVQAFCVTGVTRILDNVVLVGNGSANKNVVLDMVIVAEKTGGNVLNLNQAQDIIADVLASNTASNSSGGNNITTAVVFGTVAGSMKVDAALSGTVTPYSGTPPNPYRYVRGGVEYVVQGGSAPAVAAGAAAGTGPSASATGANDQRGKVSVTTGTSPAAGDTFVTVTFASNNAYVAAPYPIITPTSRAAAGLGLCVTSVSATGFTVGCANAPAASTSYAFNYEVRA